MYEGEDLACILLSFAAPCRGKMAASVVLAILSVAGGFVPYLGVYQIIRCFWSGRPAGRASCSGARMPCGLRHQGGGLRLVHHAGHVSAYTILEGLRLQAADRLRGRPWERWDSRPIGAMKSTIVDRIEDIEPPLAHMIPELSSNILLPLVVVIAMFAIDWRMGLALLVTIPVALIPMAFGLRTYNKNYAAYMAANAHVNSVIVEYVEGIQVVKAFSQGERSYQKFANAVRSFRDFTMDWFRCTWASMNRAVHLPTTLLGTLPMGTFLYQTGGAGPGPGDAVPDAGAGDRDPAHERHRLHQLHEEHAVCCEGYPGAAGPAPAVPGGAGRAPQWLRYSTAGCCPFSYGGDGEEVLHHLDLTIPQGKFTALVGPSGGGKSTIARLAARFWDVTGGSITLAGGTSGNCL